MIARLEELMIGGTVLTGGNDWRTPTLNVTKYVLIYRNDFISRSSFPLFFDFRSKTQEEIIREEIMIFPFFWYL